MIRFACLLLLVACVDDRTDHPPICGDSVIEGEEVCDDGNVVAGDGCHTCRMEQPVTVAWQFYPKIDEPPSTMCRAGVVKVELVGSDKFVRDFPCNEMQRGEIWALPPFISVTARLRSATDELVAEALPIVTSAGTPARFFEDAGYVRTRFRDCAGQFQIEFRPKAGGTPIVEVGLCLNDDTRGVNLSAPKREGEWDVTVHGTTKPVTILGNNAITEVEF